jgi:predicted ATPase
MVTTGATVKDLDNSQAHEAKKLKQEQATRPVATVNSNLPATTNRVIGRDETIEVIRQEVIAGRRVSIVGSGGIGKTTVAIAVAEQSIESFPDGAWLVDFAPLRDASLVPYAIATAVGLVVHSADVLTPLCRLLRDRKILLVLDNCEHLAEAIAACAMRLLANAPSLHILTTSLSPLALDGESVHRLSGLATPPDLPELSADDALTFPAVRLFVDRATDRLETFALGDADAPIVADICRTLGGIALAIELAAMRVDVFDPRALRNQLDDRFRLLAGRRAGLERHRTLSATLDWSYNLLPGLEAALLRDVSVFAGAFGVAGAAAVSGRSIDEVADILRGLISRNMVSIDVDGDEFSYRLLETTRAYCFEKLLETGEAHMIQRRHADHVCSVLELARGDWGQRSGQEWGTRNKRYLDDLRAALGWANLDTARHPLLIRLTVAGLVLWNHFSLADESRVHLMRAINQLPEAGLMGSATEMQLQLAFGGALLFTSGVVPEARDAMRRAHELSVKLGDADGRLRCLRIIGTYELFSGEHQAGTRTLETFLSLVGEDDLSAREDGETHLGCAELFVGRLQSALQRMDRLYRHYSRDLANKRFARFLYSSSVSMLIVLSHAQWLTGFSDAALVTAYQMVEYGKETKHEVSLANALAWACIVFYWAKRNDECGRHVAMLDEVVERHGIATWRPVVIFYRAAIASGQQDRPPEALVELERALETFRSTGHKARLPYYTGVVADAFFKHGRLEDADRVVREALECAHVQGEEWCVPELLRIRASIAAARNELESAESSLVEAVAIAQRVGALSWGLRSAIDLARLLRAQSRTAEARCMLRPIYGAFTEGFETRDLEVAAALLADRR